MARAAFFIHLISRSPPAKYAPLLFPLLSSIVCASFAVADTERVGKKKFPILVVETVGEKRNEILVQENEDLNAKVAKESLLAEKVFENEESIDGKSNCEFTASSSFNNNN